MKVSESLRDAIRRSGQSLAALAKAAGVDKSQLSRFMNSDRTLSLDTVDRLAACLGWPHRALDEARIAPEYGLLSVGKHSKKARLCRVEFHPARNVLLYNNIAYPSFFEFQPISKPMEWWRAIEELARC